MAPLPETFLPVFLADDGKPFFAETACGYARAELVADIVGGQFSFEVGKVFRVADGAFEDVTAEIMREVRALEEIEEDARATAEGSYARWANSQRLSATQLGFGR